MYNDRIPSKTRAKYASSFYRKESYFELSTSEKSVGATTFGNP